MRLSVTLVLELCFECAAKGSLFMVIAIVGYDGVIPVCSLRA